MPRILANAGCPPQTNTCEPACVPAGCVPTTATYQSCEPKCQPLVCCYTDLSNFATDICQQVSVTKKSNITFYNLDVGATVAFEKVHINPVGLKRYAASGLPVATSVSPTVELPKGTYRLCISALDADTSYSVESA